MKLPFKKGNEMVFQKVKSQQGFTLENQERKLTDFRDIDIEDYLADMFVTSDQFVILTAPRAQYNVRYIQACTHDGEIEVELGIEEEGTRLYYKMCSEEECYQMFLDFYENRLVPNMEEYKPVEF
ncbi:MAG: hypothetical protein HFG70_16000 [Hungatella sp.]|nr:hypothetical protein [Hungatella sp.]